MHDDTLKFSLSRRGEIEPFIVMDIMREANTREAGGSGIIHMEVGQPSTPAPRLVREAAKRAIDSELLGYTDATGTPALRERIARHYQDMYGVPVDAGRVIITTGSSSAFVLAFLALFDEGSRIALPRPGYPCYRQIAGALGLETVLLDATAAEDWAPLPQVLERLHRERRISGLLMASPANPTGVMLAAPQLRALAETCNRLKIRFISDEIYHGLTYGAPAQTALGLPGEPIVINSFSKYFSMTGWRIGWMIVPEELVRRFERLQQNLYISAPAVSQAAALAAFDAREELEAYKAVYAANRELLLNELPGAGFSSFAPADGAFYLYADVSRFTGDSVAFARRMLDETGVAVTPGLDFDGQDGRRFLRFSYARTTADMAEAVKRLRAWKR